MPSARKGKMGSGGSCLCLKCGHREPHPSGKPCQEARCPSCGVPLVRENSEHHLAFLKKKKEED